MAKNNKKNTKAKTNIETYDYSNSEVVYSNVVRLSGNSNEIEFAFGIRCPDNKKTAIITHRVFMSLQQFFNVATLVKDINENIEKQLKEQENEISANPTKKPKKTR